MLVCVVSGLATDSLGLSLNPLFIFLPDVKVYTGTAKVTGTATVYLAASNIELLCAVYRR